MAYSDLVDMRMDTVVRRILGDTSDRFYALRRKVLDFEDPEDVHRMRVNGRTLLAYLSVLADKDEAVRPGFLKLKKPLKAAMGLLGGIRDTDVLIEAVEKRSTTMPPGQRALIEGWLNQVRVERARLRERLAMELPEAIDAKWKARMKRWITERAPGLADEAAIRVKVARLRKKKDRAMRAIRAYPAPDMADEEFLDLIHEGRISVKRLRYAHNILKKPDSMHKGEVEALKALQEELGHIQDLRIWIRGLHDHYGDNDLVREITCLWRAEMLDTLASTGLLDE